MYSVNTYSPSLNEADIIPFSQLLTVCRWYSTRTLHLLPRVQSQMPRFMCLSLCVCADLDPAVVMPKDSEVMLKGESLTATCNALSSLETTTVWFKVTLQCGHIHLVFHILFRAYFHPICSSLNLFACICLCVGRD